MTLESINERLAEIHRGVRWIVTGDVSAGATEFVERLEAWGADGILVVAAAEGVGDQPKAPVVFTDAEPRETMMGAIRESFRSIREPTAEVRAAVDEFDPAGKALVAVPDVHSVDALFGRRVYGSRSATVTALEDKTTVDELWDAAGVARAPSEIVNVEHAPAAARRLANEHGTVWVADNLLGWHGGGNFNRWIGPSDEPADAVAWFARRARRVRVMPFLEGIPCSIHGFVTPAGAATFRPVEMVTLRRTDRRALMYGGVATYWDPADDDGAEMKEAARRTAAELTRRVGYLGSFSVDGVMTVDGFRPTELNPRLSAGFGRLASTVEDLAVGAMVRALREGDLDIDPAWLEETVVGAADAERTGGPYTVVQGQRFPPDRIGEAPIPVVVDDGTLRRAGDGETPDGTVDGGDNPAGAFVRLAPEPGRIPSGPSLGPLGVALIEFIEAEFGLEIGPVEAAPDVRAVGP